MLPMLHRFWCTNGGKGMLCYKCKREILAESKFCSFCGAIIQKNSYQEQFSGEDSGLDKQEGVLSKKKKFNIGIIIAVLIVSLIAILAVLLIRIKDFLPNMKKNNSQVFYLKDGELSVVLKASDSNAGDVKIGDIKNFKNENYSYYALVRLSEDGTYLYYFSKIDSSGDTGTLCRIPTGKIKGDESKNSKIVEEIDNKVNIGEYEILKDNSVVYIRKDEEITLYKDGKTYEIGKSDGVYEQLTTEEDYLIYMDKDKLYAAEVSTSAESIEIDDDVTELYEVGSKDFILYGKEDKDGNKDLYVAGTDGKSTLVAEGVYTYFQNGFVNETESFYFETEGKKEYMLYDFVNDPYTAEDAAIKEPTVKDFFIEISATKAVSKSDWSEYKSSKDFSEYLRDEGGYYYRSLDVWSYWNSDEACWYYYNENEGKWYSYDEDSYYVAKEKYGEAEERILLREVLKDEKVTSNYYKLYYYEKGAIKEVCDIVDEVMTVDRQAILYTKIPEAPKKVFNIEDIYSAYDLRQEIESGYENDNYSSFYFCNAGSGESEVSDFDDSDSYRIYGINWMHMLEDGKMVIFHGVREGDEGCQILSYPVLSDGLGDYIEVSDSGYSVGTYKNQFYYFEDVDDEGFGKMYSFDGKKSYLIAKEILSSHGIFCAEDGGIFGYSDSDEGVYELSRYNEDGESEKIVEDISSYAYMGNGCFLFFRDNDLYYLNKKREEYRIARDVDYYIAPGRAEGQWIW